MGIVIGLWAGMPGIGSGLGLRLMLWAPHGGVKPCRETPAGPVMGIAGKV
ncbi:hypothetical protein [Billgrantia saliphila]|nr:hypothetical protein [Halomonas saliphila]